MGLKKSKILLDSLFELIRLPHSRVYKLEGKTPVPCGGYEYYEWRQSLKERVTRVGEDFIDGVRVSTVFLGIDHNLSGEGPPVLFETMVFGGPLNEYQDRYCTWEEAEKGHQEMCNMVRSTSKGMN